MQPQHQQMWRRCLSFYRMPIVLSLHWKAIAYPGFISKQSTYVFALQNLSSGQDLLSIYMAQALADHTDQRRANLGAQRDAAIPCALQRIGALRLATVRARSEGQTARREILCCQWAWPPFTWPTCISCPALPVLLAGLTPCVPCTKGEYEEATGLFRRAASSTAGALSAGIGSLGMRIEPSPWALKESAASAHSGAGQVALAQRQWEAAEEPLSEVASKYLQLCTCQQSAHACSETLIITTRSARQISGLCTDFTVSHIAACNAIQICR